MSSGIPGISESSGIEALKGIEEDNGEWEIRGAGAVPYAWLTSGPFEDVAS